MKSFLCGLAGLAVVVLAGTDVRPGEKNKPDKEAPTKGLSAKSLVGTYELISGERDGKPIPNDKLNAATIRFTADTITVVDREDKNVYVANYRLAGDAQGRISMNSVKPEEGMVAEGLVKREGDMLRLIYALPGGKTPTSFKTQEKQQLFVLRKVDKK